MTITLDVLRMLDDDAFNRAVAEMEGYCVARDVEMPPEREQWFYVYLNGDIVGYVPASNEDEAWAAALEADHQGERYVPDYANDLNAAWGLWDVPPILMGNGKGEAVAYHSFTEGIVHKQPARALSTAFAAWKLAQEGEA